MFNKTNQKQKAAEKYLSPVTIVGTQYRRWGGGEGGLSSSKWVKPFSPEYWGWGGGGGNEFNLALSNSSS